MQAVLDSKKKVDSRGRKRSLGTTSEDTPKRAKFVLELRGSMGCVLVVALQCTETPFSYSTSCV